MKKTYLLISALVALLLASCGGGKKANTIKPVSEKITGPLGAYFEVVSKDYVPTDRGNVNIELRRIQAGFPKPWNSSMKVGYSDGCFEPLFTAEFQDENGNTLSKDKTDIVFDRDDLESLAALLVDESCTLSFSVNNEKARQVKLSSTFEVHEDMRPAYSKEVDNTVKYVVVNATDLRLRYAPSLDSETLKQNDGKKNEHPEKGEKFLCLGEENDFYKIDYYGEALWVSKQYTYIDGEGGFNTSFDDLDIDFSDSGSADWDKILDEYEQFVNKYYNYAEKVSKGNASAMTDALSMAEKAQSLADKLERADDNLSTAQANRLLKIQNKMIQAASKMAGAASKVEDMMDDLQNMDVEELLNNMPDLPGF